MTNIKAYIALTIANILLGMNFSIYESILSKYMNFKTLFILRISFSMLFFLPYLLTKKRYKIELPDFIKIFIPTTLVIFGHQLLLILGASYTSAVDAAIIATLAPIATLSASAIATRERLSIHKYIAISIGFIATLILIFKQGIPDFRSSEFGNSIILISVIAAATNTMLIKSELVKLGTLKVMGWYYAIGLIISFPLFGDEMITYDYSSLPKEGIIEIGYILILGTLLPNFLLYYGVERINTSHSALFSYLQPIAATSLAAIQGRSNISSESLLSGVLMLISISLIISKRSN